MSEITMPPQIAEFITRNYPSGLFYANENFYRYQAGAWEQIEERAHVRHRLARFFGKDAAASRIGDALTLLKDFLVRNDQSLNQNKHLICLSNGTLNTQTYKLLEHSPSHALTNRTDNEWKPEAQPTRFLQFMDECFANDIDKQQKIDFLQEWMGYCLVPDTSLHKCVWLVGAGANGKSVFLSTLIRLVGGHNVSHAYMERLGEKCVRAELEGKLLNVSSEMSAEATISDGYFKAIVSGDIVEAERKFKPSFSFRPTVRLIASTNNMPRLLDHSDGFKRRLIIIMFNRQFAEHDQDPGLEGKLAGELSGILTWAVEGLRRLRERRCFEIPESSVVALAQYKMESDPVALFAEECLERVTSFGMRPIEVYQAYQDWCRKNGFSPFHIINFGKRLTAHGFATRRSGGNTFWLVTRKDEDCIEGQSTRISEGIPLVLQGFNSPVSRVKPSGYKL